MKNGGNGLKWLGIGLTIVGAIIGIASSVVSDKQQEARINEAVDNKFALLVDSMGKS